MAQIAEDLLLLLLDNAAGRPVLDPDRRKRVLAAAVLLDLAHAGRIRPSTDGEPVTAGWLVLLRGPELNDPVLQPAVRLLQRRPLRPETAVAKLRRGVEGTVLQRLEHSGQIEPIGLRGKRIDRTQAWKIADRAQVDNARTELLSALVRRRPPTPATAAIISLLHPVDGLTPLLSLGDRGWRSVNDRAGDIATGYWVNERPAGVPEINLAITTAAVQPALTGRKR